MRFLLRVQSLIASNSDSCLVHEVGGQGRVLLAGDACPEKLKNLVFLRGSPCSAIIQVD